MGIVAVVAVAGLAVVAASIVSSRGLGTVSVRRVRRAGLFRGLRRGGVVVRRWRGGGVGKRGLSRGTAGGAGIVDARRGGVLGTIAVEVGRIEGGMVAFRSRSGGMRVGVRKGFVVAQQVGGHGGTATNEHGDAGCGQQVRGHGTGCAGGRGDAETAGCGGAGGRGTGSGAAGHSGCGLSAGCGSGGHDGGATGDDTQN